MRWLLLLFGLLSAEIVEIHSFKEAADVLSTANEKTLVVFDVDSVLLMPRPPIFQPQNRIRYRAILERLLAPLTAEERSLVGSLLIAREGATLVEPQTPALIRQLQQRGVPCLALTAAISSSCNGWGDLRHDRFESLTKLGISFKAGLPDQDLEGPVYSRGIIYTNGSEHPKGEVLRRYLRAIRWWPERVIFFDDTWLNLDSMERDLALPHTGFHYRAIDRLEGQDYSPLEVESAWRPIIQQAVEAAARCP